MRKEGGCIAEVAREPMMAESASLDLAAQPG